MNNEYYDTTLALDTSSNATEEQVALYKRIVAQDYQELEAALQAEQAQNAEQKASLEAEQAPIDVKHLDVAPLPHGFKVKNGGLWYEQPSKKEDDEGELLYIGRALYVTALARDKQNEGWGLRVEWSDSDDVSHHWTLPASMLASSDVSGWLSVLPAKQRRCSNNT